MKITVIGRGNIGGGLAKLWGAAAHEVTTVGRDGGDASGADVVVIAVPGQSIADALSRVSGLGGKTAIDATNIYVPRATLFASLAEEVKSITQGAVAKSFNLNFASLFDEIANQRVRPTSFFAADDEARDVTERLISDAGYEPVFVGGLDKARALEELGWLPASAKGGTPVFYRFAEAGEL